MTERLPMPPSFASAPLRAAGRTALVAFTVTLAGCRHNSAPVVLPVATTAPVALETPPQPSTPPKIDAQPTEVVVAPPMPVAKKPVVRKKAAPPPPTAPVQVAEAAPEPSVSIGALSAGGGSSQQSRQETTDLMASIQKRLAALPAKTADAQKEQIKTVRNFLLEARKALASGDADGARTLATKAKLVMDDVEK